MTNQLPSGPAVDGWCQRWRDRTPAWRHRDIGGFDPGRYTVVELDKQRAARLVRAHHYAHSFPAARFSYGLIDRTPHLDDYPDPDPSALLPTGRLVGVAAFAVPMHPRVLLAPFPHLTVYTESIELARLILLDPVPGNGETWFLGRVFRRVAARGIRGVVAFSDPVPRYRGGNQIMPGHVGWIYQGHNAAYLGRATRRPLIMLPDGTSILARNLAKVTGQERGWRGVVTRLQQLGAPPVRPGEQPGSWLRRALDAVDAYTVRHPGNHRYAWRLRRSRRASYGLPAAEYPKAVDPRQLIGSER
ncbi:hypothetical protein AB0M46_13565 [Dactylosporangium sp. NPDC051485]|uniref:Mom family adenine methylcarbamoylation protein n=1 Tax=Dactylosporangium sp. NPDC051485 TaxID=3154846 RepID=UPI00342FD9F2